ncbi:unnamed protein product, partial [Arabidopsis halleri]
IKEKLNGSSKHTHTNFRPFREHQNVESTRLYNQMMSFTSTTNKEVNPTSNTFVPSSVCVFCGINRELPRFSQLYILS